MSIIDGLVVRVNALTAERDELRTELTDLGQQYDALLAAHAQMRADMQANVDRLVAELVARDAVIAAARSVVAAYKSDGGPDSYGVEELAEALAATAPPRS